MLAIVALHVLPAAAFALIHGAMLYRWRGMLVFTALCLAIGGSFEILGIRTGFPFGSYYFTDLMGPKIFGVPVLLGLAYVGMGYLSWTLGRMILGNGEPIAGFSFVAVPLVASFLMVAWDLAMDPIWSTVTHAWIRRHGGGYFGVPVSNFFGWYLTVYAIYQSFALYVRAGSVGAGPMPRGYWRLAVLFYGVSAAGNLLLEIPRTGAELISDSAGAQWSVSGITGACALVSVFAMGTFAVLAAIRHAGA
jgi:putative membrane protein